MKDFVAIDLETANPQRVSACAIGYAKVSNCKLTDAKGHLIKPVGGHAPFQSKIHGIKEEHTFDKPYFGELFPKIKDVFNYPLVAHSLFDKQVLDALSEHFNLGLNFHYIDSCAVAKEKLPHLKDCKLKTLVKHFGLPAFKHHDAKEDAISCANVFLKLQDQDTEQALSTPCDELSEFKGMLRGILADDQVNYKEAYELLYWLEDHKQVGKQYQTQYCKIKESLSDDRLDSIEATDIKMVLSHTLSEFE
jgi:DNA polymerase III, epsilon subunit and related 3'-5' exonucleases